MAEYFAITRRNDHWVYVNSGIDPEEVYREAVEIIESQAGGGGDEDYDNVSFILPVTERQLNELRVVTEEAARDLYHVIGPRAKLREA